MTDMRATERLLEVIEERCEELERGWRDGYKVDAESVIELAEFVVNTKYAVRELRRRGDTLVRADDLRVLLESIYMEMESGHPVYAARDRLENALGGKMR